MSIGEHKHRPVPAGRPLRTTLALAATVCSAAAVGGMVAAMALAAGGSSIVSTASNGKLKEKVAVNSQGRTLYALSPETAGHLLCKSAECLNFWPPLTVRSAKAKLHAGPGVKGKLGTLRRGPNKFQVTLAGMPLYTFKGDSAKGQANGQGLKTFGGTWHVVTEGGSTHSGSAGKSGGGGESGGGGSSGGGSSSGGGGSSGSSGSSQPESSTPGYGY
ncbi:MAG: hypothetical protein FWD42_01660 [Solirubrobacterales bacterium]|nr:hypothetical protein [Solirubrobacterales bacterium]